MSEWQRPQLALVMKKFAGMVRCTFVSPDEGKNGLDDPRPSSFMLTGTIDGLRMTLVAFIRAESLVAATGAAIAASTAIAHAAVARRRSRALPCRTSASAPTVKRGKAPVREHALCAGSSHRHRPAAPTTVIRRPK